MQRISAVPKLYFIVGLCTFSAFLMTCGPTDATDTTKQSAAEPATETAPEPAAQGRVLPNTLSPVLPHAITATPPFSLESLQLDFDVFSWESFVALNWPVGSNGEADPTKTIGDSQTGDNATVWETWMQSTSIFLENGGTPAAWGSDPVAPEICSEADKVLSSVGKTPNLLEANSQPFKTGPLIDQNGVYTRFEILTNQPMFNYIVQHQLYNRDGQRAFSEDVDFPASVKDGPLGAVMVKAAWRILDDKDDPSRFHTSKALVYSPAFGPDPAQCKEQTVGLVGFHIAHKTTDETQWIWSTFEHVDNCPDINDVANGTLKDSYNYFNKDCTDCEKNEPPPRPWDPAKTGPPTQVVRQIPITDEAKKLNEHYHNLLRAANAKSVWVNYELVSTQWPTVLRLNPNQTPKPEGVPAPQFLANATLETYIQGTVPNVSSSCIACHNNATTTTAKFSDFTYLLELAKEKK